MPANPRKPVPDPIPAPEDDLLPNDAEDGADHGEENIKEVGEPFDGNFA